MLRVNKILKIDSFLITCEFNNGLVRTIDVGPIIKNRSNLKGIDELKNPETFSKANIGIFGEIVWDKIITTTYNGQKSVWDNDLSPEFIFENSM